MRVVVLSLEPWNDVWRRNQHLCTALVQQGVVSQLTFVEPPAEAWTVPSRRTVSVGVEALPAPRWLPRRMGGLRVSSLVLRATLATADVLWINDPRLGAACLSRGVPSLYDVTDDWRTARQEPAALRRLILAEDLLARRARTVVCSEVLADRWRDRYGVTAAVIPNGVNTAALQDASPMDLAGPAPHVGYVGTLHDERLDVALVLELAATPDIGTVHLVGPDSLDQETRGSLLRAQNVVLHGAVTSADVPRWLRGLDVLICPHLVSPFTLSLDAIKSHEYLASGKPVVATSTSGFQNLAAPGLSVEGRRTFAAAVLAATRTPGPFGSRSAVDWADRAAGFGAELVLAAEGRSR